MDFKVFKLAVAKQFDIMQKHSLFRVSVEKDTLWDTYLNSFPAGTNELYRERTEHDCSCCRQFIRALGDVIAIIDGKVVSIWDINVSKSEPGYQVVADALAALVKSKSIDNKFLHYERTAGTDKNFEQMIDGIKTWDHFHVNINTKFVLRGSDIASTLAGPRASHDAFQNSLNKIDFDSIDTVSELIAQGSLYRGAENAFAVNEFRKLKKEFDKIPAEDTLKRDLFIWAKVESNTPESVLKFRGTAIGSLAEDLAKNVDLEDAVKMFESKVAPDNYKRPTALVTKGMIEDAKAKLESLGLTSALARRYANINDVAINDILFADREARKIINGDVFDELVAANPTKVKSIDKVEEISIAKFLADILPQAKSLEVLIENHHASNMVSLIAPQDPTAGELFKWPNKFSWSYAGEMADSIKERVKKAGGSVEGDLCCRLAWDYTDDLDFIMEEPTRDKIYFGVKRMLSRNGGMLDLDANGGDGQKPDPAENIFYKDRKKMADGIYNLKVNNYNRRSTGRGFIVEIDFDGQITTINYDKVLKTGDTIMVARIKKTGSKFEIIESLPSTASVREIWKLPSQSFHPVSLVMLSPNYWNDKAVGNQHFFFMLEGCKNDGTARGFFNEFLKEELNQHRKVFEIVGSKMKVPDAEDQLSGLGFSSTQKNALVVRVKGSFTRTIKIVF